MENRDGGAFWYATDRETGERRVTKNGDKFWTGNITINGEKHNATMFFNKEKKNEKGPDFSIVFQEERPQAQETRSQEITTEDIPF